MKTRLAYGAEAVFQISRTPLDPRYDFGEAHDSVALCLELGFADLTLERTEKETGDEFGLAAILPKVQLILHDRDSNGCPLLGRAVDRETIDWDLIRRWLKACDDRHRVRSFTEGSANLPKRRQDLQLCAIDVERNCIVSLPKNARYIALSYTWGKDQRVKLKKANAQMLATPGFFDTPNSRPSRTIADAIKVARLLGCEYLWVDALCIMQDDAESIQANVGSMDQVYAGAWVTIVAVAGDNADSGLPGVSRDLPRTQRQMRVNIHGIVMANMLESDSDAINFSRWNTRGWTYQERLLSRKLLAFTSSQVYFHCDQGCDYREDIQMSDDSATLTLFDARYQLELENQNLFDVYAMAVAEYTNRCFTDPADKLKALNGLLNRLAGPFRGSFFFGLPTTVFDVALLWKPVGACSRDSKEFPSWSWAGWNGPVRYAMRDSMSNLCECSVSQATIESSNDVRLCSEISDVERREEDIIGEWKRFLDEETLAIHYTVSDAQYQYPRPLAALAEDEILMLAQEDTGVLKIHAMTASFLLSKTHTKMFVLWSTCREGRHQQCHLSVLDEKSRVAGTVFVDGRIAPQLQNRKHKFLALSRCTLNRLDIDPSWDDETNSFRSWTHPSSGVRGGTEDYLENIRGIKNGTEKRRQKEHFDEEHFNDHVFWPVLDVLLLSEPQNGIVERVGIGKMHVDAFFPVAKQECILLR
jgi:hypothetical protein